MKQKIYSYIRPVGIKFDFINHNFKLEFDDSGLFLVHDRDEDPDPVGSVDFWPAGSGTFFIGSGSGSYL